MSDVVRPASNAPIEVGDVVVRPIRADEWRALWPLEIEIMARPLA